MRRFRWAMPILFLFLAGMASADSIPTFTISNAIIDVFPNSGAGDNVGFIFTGPGGFILSGFGGSGCCFEGDTFSAGDPIGGIFFISWSFLTLTIGKTTYDPDTVDLSPIDINPLGALSVPGGSVPATLSNSLSNGPIHVSGGSGDEFVLFNLAFPHGTFSVDFGSVEGNPSLYQFSGAEFRAVSTVPEPGTLALMPTGLAGIVGLVRRKRGRALR